MKVTLENPIEGYEPVAEYRYPALGEHYLEISVFGGIEIIVCDEEYHSPWLVLTPIKKVYDWSKTAPMFQCCVEVRY